VNKENKKQKIYEKKWFAIGLIVLVTFLVYANTLKNEFVYDDNAQIIDNHLIRNIEHVGKLFTSSVWSFQGLIKSNYYRPIQFLTYTINYHIFGLKPFPFHLTNVIFHVLVTVVFFLLANYLLKNIYGAIIAALFFAIHPMHTESVAWISASNDVICTLFYLISFYLYIKFTEKKSQYKIFLIFGSLLCFAFALFSKEMAVTLPFVLVFYNFINNRKINLQRFTPYLIILFLYILVRNHVLGGFAPQNRYAELSNFQIIFNIFPLMVKYFSKLLFPVNFNAFYGFKPVFTVLDIKVILSFLITGIVAMSFIAVRKKHSLITLSGLWILITIVPVLYIRGVGLNVFCERYLYLPSIGFCFLLSYLLMRFLKVKLRIWIVMIILGFYSYKTVKRNVDWKDDYSLWVKTVKTSPSRIVHFNFAGGCYKRKLYEQAIPELKWVIKAEPDELKAHFMLGSIYSKKGWWDKAEVEYKKIIEIDPNYPKAHFNLGNCFRGQGRYDKAAAEYKKEIEINPDYAKAHYNLGWIYHKKRRLEKAITEYKKTIEIKPDFAEAYSNLGVIYAGKGQYDRAIEKFKFVLQLKPDYAGIQKNLELVYKEKRLHKVAGDNNEAN